MTLNDFDYLLQLPGEERELIWIRERLEALSAREGVILSAAALRTAPETAADAINCLQSLDCYKVRVGVGSYDALGSAYLRNETKMPKSAQPFADLEQIGRWYEDKHPGLFVGNCYVEYPKNALQPVYQGRDSPLPEDMGWSVRLKIASPAVPEGVWLCLPSASNWDDEAVQDVTLALQELHVQHLDDCTLLDARCFLPEAGDLTAQYDSIADLVNDGKKLGSFLSDWEPDDTEFTQKYIAALELEDCRNLKLALDIYKNLDCYDWVPCSDLEISTEGLLLDARLPEDLIYSGCIDLSGYKAHLLDEQGYTFTTNGSGYIARNSQEFHYFYSTPSAVRGDNAVIRRGHDSVHDYGFLAELSGTRQEQEWLRERLETLSVRELTVLEAAIQCMQPQDAEGAVNCLQSLECYEVQVGIGSYEALGSAYLQNETRMPKSAQPFADLDQLGRWYAGKHPGQFAGDHYVEYPKSIPQPVYHGPDTTLPEDNDWSVKLKVASPAVPEGVWLRLPGPFQEGLEGTVEEALALQALHIQRWDECTLLDTQCILPEAGNLMEQYDDVGDLIYDGIELGYILAQKGQGMPCFMERYAAALNLEHCRSLKLAMDIAQNLNCYDWVPCADLETSATGLLLDSGVSEELIRASGIDLAGYKAHLLEEQGYNLIADKSGYIARNSQEFHYCYSTPTPEQSGMMMQ